MVRQRHGLALWMWTGRFVSAYEYNGDARASRPSRAASPRARRAGASEDLYLTIVRSPIVSRKSSIHALTLTIKIHFDIRLLTLPLFNCLQKE